MTIEDFKKYALNELKKSPSPLLDLNVLLEHFLKLNKTKNNKYNIVRTNTSHGEGV